MLFVCSSESDVSSISSIIKDWSLESNSSFISISIVPVSCWVIYWSRTGFSATGGFTFGAHWLAVDSKSISAWWEIHKLGEADSRVSFSWWSDLVLFHHWEASWVDSVNVSESGGSIRAIWGWPLGKSNSRVSFSWWSDLVLFHHWEASWMDSVNVSESRGSIWAIWRRPLW